MNARQIIAALGGPSKVAELCGLVTSAVSMWQTGGIPSGRWKQLLGIAQTQGRSDITIEILMASEPAPRVRSDHKRAA